MLTAQQQKTLKDYADFHEAPPSSWWIFSRAARSHIILTNVLGGIAWIAFVAGIPYVSLLLVGMIVGVVSRNIVQLLNTVHVWPLLSQIIDWHKVDGLMSDNANPNIAG